uniref:Chromogranin-A n=1 Tax=Esox lucius TaxID=8010 RepID=A0AAY5KT68_ESOLU
MIARGYILFTILLINHVLSLPVTPTFLEKDDVEVIKCIVEVLAHVLSRPHPLPVSQECMNTLRKDERLVSILRHRNFLKELQDIAIQGANDRAKQNGDFIADYVDNKPQVPQGIDAAADRSMLVALGGPGERSILSQKRATGGAEEVDGEGEMKKYTETDGELSSEGNEILGNAPEKKREKDESPDNHITDGINEEGKGERDELINKKEEEEKEEDVVKRSSSEEESEENGTEGENVSMDKKGLKSDELKYAQEETSEKTSAEEQVSEVDSEMDSEVDGLTHRSRLSTPPRGLQAKKSAEEKEMGQDVRSLQFRGRQEVPHHSKEVLEEEEVEEEKRKEGEARKSLEVKRLQMMARREPEEMRGGREEEGSASRKTEVCSLQSNGVCVWHG